MQFRVIGFTKKFASGIKRAQSLVLNCFQIAFYRIAYLFSISHAPNRCCVIQVAWVYVPNKKIYLIARPPQFSFPRISHAECPAITLKIIFTRNRCKDAPRFQADTDYLIGPNIVNEENGLETARLGLKFRVANKHFRRGDMKLKCLATIATVYLQSNEESVLGDESILKTPIMESRETRAQSHTREDLTNGKSLPSSLFPFGYHPLLSYRNCATFPRYRLTLPNAEFNFTLSKSW